MCEHEGRPCPGRSCRCECMTCMFPDEDDDEQEDPTYLSHLYASEMENPL